MKNIGIFTGLVMILLRIIADSLELQAGLQLYSFPLTGIDNPTSVAHMKQS